MNEKENEIFDLIKMIIDKKNNSSLNHKIEFNADADIRDNYGLDSLDLAELTVVIEDRYGIDIFETGIVSTINEISEKLKE
jgi:acyl carrier protein